ncbi:MAG: hypothetical protein Q8L14_20375 [Myxococcales bacterium]|nr:hypothetical protein [Myxococcales bacterium]
MDGAGVGVAAARRRVAGESTKEVLGLEGRDVVTTGADTFVGAISEYRSTSRARLQA